VLSGLAVAYGQLSALQTTIFSLCVSRTGVGVKVSDGPLGPGSIALKLTMAWKLALSS
jgi:hypothetical protein